MPFTKGQIPWNNGLTKETDERVQKYAEKLKGQTIGFKKGYTPWNKGLTKETDSRVYKNYQCTPIPPEEQEICFFCGEPITKRGHDGDCHDTHHTSYEPEVTVPAHGSCHLRHENIGNKHSLETRHKMSESRTGRKHSPETKRKMSEAMKGNKNPAKRPEVRKKISERMRKRS